MAEISKLAQLSSVTGLNQNIDISSSDLDVNSVWVGGTSVGGAVQITKALASNLAGATNLNTASQIVQRDASGNFSAGTITANLTGVASGNLLPSNNLSDVASAALAFKNIAPLTTAGDMLYENSTPAPARLPIGTNGQILTVVGGLPAWSNASPTGVTSVALADGSATPIYAISGSPITGSGTLTFSLNTQSANQVFAGPASGSAAQPGFRALVSADIPNNAANTSGTASNITATSNSSLTTLSSLSLPGSQVTGNISGTASNITASSNSTLTTLSSLSLPGSQVTGNISGNAANITATTNSTLTTLSALSLPTSQLSGSVSLTTQVSGILPIANGGTGANSTSQNYVFAGPSTGGSGAPSFRALVAADLPSLSGTYLPLTGGTMSGSINGGGYEALNFANPTSAQSLATRAYVDSAINGLTWKGPVHAFANSNIALTGGASLTIDSYSVQNGDFVILSAQTTASQNNVYVASGIGSSYSLSVASGAEAATALGDAYLVLQGTVFGNTAYQVNQLTPNLTFMQFAGPNTYSFNGPLSLSGNVVSITQATTSTNGYLSSTDWNTFNSKQAAGNYMTALTGDVTASGPGSSAATISAGAVTLAKMANLAANSIIGNNTGSAATPIALTGTQVTAMLNLFSSSLQGLAPASGGGTVNFLRADGTWAAPAGSVTSVALADSTGIFNISGSPVTSSGTLTLSSLKSQTANTFLAAPNGSSGAPTFRVIAVADVPTLNQNTTGTAANITATSNSTLTTLSALSLPASQLSGQVSIANGGTGLASTSQNYVFAGPGTGGSGAPSFRALVAADVPTLNQNTTGTAANITATSNSTLTTLSALSLPTSQLSGSISLTTQVSGTLPIANGGTGATSTSQAFAFIGPTSGSGAPSFRALVSTDIPTLNQNTTGTAANITATTNSTLTTISTLVSVGTITTGTWSATTITTAHGGTGVTSVTTAPTASAFAGWDANKNLSANNHIEGYATTATAAGTTTLVVGSAYQQYFTGTSTQTVVMPVATTLVNGMQFVIVNNSTGNVTVQTSGSVSIQVMSANTQLVITCINTAGGTGIASWSWSYTSLASVTGSQTANTFYAAPNGSSGVPTFRAIVSADIPTLNQNTTGTAANITASSNSTLTTLSALSLPAGQITGQLAIANGGTGAATTSQAFAFIGPVSGSGAPSFRAIVATDIPTLNQNTTGSAATVSGTNVITASNMATGAFDQATIVGGNGTAANVVYAPMVQTVETSDQALTATTLVALRYELSSDSSGTVGRVWKADNNASTNNNFYVIGLAYPSFSVAQGATVKVVGQGLINVPSHGFTTGVPLYLGSSGALTTTAPSSTGTAIVRVGIVKDANNIYVHPVVVGIN